MRKSNTMLDGKPEPCQQVLSGKTNYKLVVMGAAGVGKTCIVTRFLYEKFMVDHKRTIEELHRGEYQIAGMPLVLDILDTSGSFPFPAMRKLSILTGDAFILVYSVDDQSSFEEVQSLRQQIIDEKGGDQNTPIVIVGNKSDLAEEQREVGREIAEWTASIDWGHGYVEASAKDGTNIITIFTQLLKYVNVHVGTALSPSTGKGRGYSSKSKVAKTEACVIS